MKKSFITSGPDLFKEPDPEVIKLFPCSSQLSIEV